MQGSATPSLAFDAATQRNLDRWLEGGYGREGEQEIRRLLDEDPLRLVDAFYTHLSFGTGGLRGLMGVGPNRMNVYTVRAATQGLANYLRGQAPPASGIEALFIGYDSRHYSREFAEETAKVLAGNGFRAYLCRELRPTPLISFGCRYKRCRAAVMITASHNPPAYNGYKVFWSDGGQVLPPHDGGIMHEVLQVLDSDNILMARSLDHPLIEEVGAEIDDAYIEAISTLQHYPEVNQREGSRCRILYSSLHGTGITLVPKALHAWGFTHLDGVQAQIIPDGAFPTVHSPNPEEREALEMGIEQMLSTECDLFMATDPDADRVGVAVRHEGRAVLLNGNQISSICLEHVCHALSRQRRLSPKAAFIKTIGTSELFQAICDAYRRPCFNVLTGFKYIAGVIRSWETAPEGKDAYEYVFGGEESYGYLLGSFTRDKDAVTSCALIAEVALQAKLEGKTLIDKLHDLYRKYGIYQESLRSLSFEESKEGKEKMKAGMLAFRHSLPRELSGVPLVSVEDYLTSTRHYLESGKKEPLSLPRSDVLLCWLKDGSKVMIRPSGTEPKVKLYAGVCNRRFSLLDEGIADCLQRCQSLLTSLERLFANPCT